jgi:hypothetical protein
MKRWAALRLMNGTAFAPILGATVFWNHIISILRLNTYFRLCRLHGRCTHSNYIERVMDERCVKPEVRTSNSANVSPACAIPILT